MQTPEVARAGESVSLGMSGIKNLEKTPEVGRLGVSVFISLFPFFLSFFIFLNT